MSLYLRHCFVFSVCFLKILPSVFSLAELADSMWYESTFHRPFTKNTYSHHQPIYLTTQHPKYYNGYGPIVLTGPSEKKRYDGGGFGGMGFPSQKKKTKKSGGKSWPIQRSPPMMQGECKGMENLVMDLGYVSYGIGLAGFIIGIVDLGWSIAGQFFSVTSTWASYIAAIPSAIITLSGKADPLTYIIANIFSVISIWATVWSHIGLPVGDMSIYIGVLGEALGLVSIITGAFATFPKLLTDLIQFLVEKEGREVQVFVDNYRCP